MTKTEEFTATQRFSNHSWKENQFYDVKCQSLGLVSKSAQKTTWLGLGKDSDLG